MMRMTIAEIVAACAGTLVQSDQGCERNMVEGITWDSREIRQGMAFLAMPGERVDGNDFVGSAVCAGAGCVLASREPTEAVKALAGEFMCPIVMVQDGTAALTALAAYWRGKLHAMVVGVTGSSGKTSTKELLRSVLSEKFKTVATVSNYNNEIGVPATVLSADEDTEVLVVEMGMRGLHQIEALCEFVRPSIGVVTNIGVSHLELLGTRENIALAKSELFSCLPSSGLAVANYDDPYTPLVLEDARIDARHIARLSYGFSEAADVRAADVAYDDAACARFSLLLKNAPATTVYLNMPGRHNVANALAAAAVGQYLGMSTQQIVDGLEKARPGGMRMEVAVSGRGVRVVNDAYNANPDSMRASLDTLASMDCPGRRVAVLGDMGELGATEVQLHEEVGAYAARSELDLLVCVGELARHMAAGARAEGMEDTAIIEFDTPAEAAAALNDVLVAGDVLLVKASRFMGLEQIVKEIA